MTTQSRFSWEFVLTSVALIPSIFVILEAKTWSDRFWMFVAVCVIFKALGYLLDRRRKAIETKEAEQRKREESRKVVSAGLKVVNDAALESFEKMPALLVGAEDALEKAKTHYKEGAFAPFWDSVEEVATALATFDKEVESLRGSARLYGEFAAHSETLPPRFSIATESIQGMVVANTIADRMQPLVREAQRNFEFAMIYQQRRTNQLLVAGFKGLAQAVDALGARITLSIDSLSDQVTSLIDQIANMSSSIDRSLSGLRTTLEAQHVAGRQQNEQQALALAERHDKALEMLNNLQRRRIPIPHEIGDQAY